MLILNYKNCELVEWEPKVKECCEKKKPGKPEDTPATGTGDCCYDGWMDEYNEVTGKLNTADKEVTAITNHLNYVKTQRDFWGTWYDELTKADDSARKVCNQLEIILHHLHRISKNTSLTVRSLKILYCMLRDFYMQVDLLKVKYDALINCLQCINNPALATGQGIRPLIDDYGKKLDAVIGTRDALFDAFIAVIGQANRIDKSLGHHFGLHTVLNEWQKAFHCEEHCYDEHGEHHHHHNHPGEGQIEDIGLDPMLEFPICDSPYFKHISDIYDEDERLVDQLNKELLDASKKRDKYKAWKDGLDAVIKAVDPATRCSTTPAK
jgi:hypothetical protein